MISLNNKNIKYYLLFGCDISNQVYSSGYSLSDEERNMRSDTIILVILNTKTKKIKLVSILRDICVDVKGHGKCKINSLIVYFGPKKTTKIIGNLLGITISKYITLNMKNMIEVIDLIGGVDVELSYEEIDFINNMMLDSTIITEYQGNVSKLSEIGLNHLNGIQTLTHVRNRFFGYTWARTRRQRDVLIAIVKQIQNNVKPNQYIKLGLSMLKFVKTNLNIIDICQCAMIAKNIKINEIETYSIPSTNTKSIKDDGLWRFEIDFKDANFYLQKIVNDEDVKDFVI